MDFDFELNSDPLNEIESNINIIEDQKKTENQDRFITLIETLGLNVNIVYPINFIRQIIVELHLSSKKNTNITRFSRIYKFKDDNYSKKIRDILNIDEIMYISINLIDRVLRRLYRHYRWNLYESKDKTNLSNIIIGFNYMNPCWNSLETLII